MTGKFSLQWINSGTSRNRPMNSVRFNIRDVQGLGEGLTCEALHVDQLHIIFVPSNSPALTGLFRSGDGINVRWRAEAQLVNVRLTPGERYVLATRGTTAPSTVNDTTVVAPQLSAAYSASFCNTPYTGAPQEEFWCRSYRPVRDLPAARHLQGVSQLQIDLLWPLLQGNPEAIHWAIPDYRIDRVVVDFSYH